MLVLLFIMSAYRLLFFYHYGAPGRPFSGSAFLLGFRYDLRTVSILALAMLLTAYFPYLNPFRNFRSLKAWIIILSIIFLIFLIFYGADFYHYDYLQQRLNASVLNFIEDAAISFNMMWQTYPLLKITLIIFIIVIGFAWLIKRWYKYISRSAGDPPVKRSATGWHIAFILLLAIAIFGQVGQYPLRWSDAFRFADDFKGNTALNPFQSFFSSLKFKRSAYDIKKVKAAYPVMADYLQVDHPDSNTLNLERNVIFADTFVNKPNVIIVICESFSSYKSSMFGNKLDPTPFFNELCNQGVFFERCFVPTFGTARGVWATITGIPDVEDPKTASRNPSAVDQHSIMNDFKTYSKYYFIGGSTTWANIRGVLTNNLDGLQIYEEEDFKANKVDVWGISDKHLLLESNKILSKEKRPFISIIQTADNHRPYTIPSDDLDEFKKVNYPIDTLRKYGFAGNDELNAFRYTDFCFRKFMESASAQPWFANTVFVFIGDHGLRGDAGNMFPSSFTQQGIGAQHVPLLFYSPRLLGPLRINTVCSQTDVMPSVASIARQSYRNNTLGRDLFDSSDTKDKYAFISDPDLRTIGLVNDRFYYRKNLKTGEKEFVSVTDNAPVVFTPHTDSLRNYMAILTDAWYETAKYLLLNNKKKK
jgi:phosphoglycerol transferase MdoB-like AlkP superfamily enzyme